MQQRGDDRRTPLIARLAAQGRPGFARPQLCF
jgi:hypothetical protein